MKHNFKVGDKVTVTRFGERPEDTHEAHYTEWKGCEVAVTSVDDKYLRCFGTNKNGLSLTFEAYAWRFQNISNLENEAEEL